MSFEGTEPALTASAGLLRVLLAAGPPLQSIMATFVRNRGIDPASLEQSRMRLPLKLVRDAWDEATTRTGDGLLGLHMANKLPFGALDVIDYLAKTSETLQMAFERVVRFGALLANAGEMTFRVDERFARFTHCAEQAHPAISQLIMSLVLRRAAAFTGVAIRPISVNLMQKALGPRAQYDEAFGAKTSFGHHVDELVFDMQVTNLPLLTAEPALGAILVAHAEREVALLPVVGSFLSMVSRKIAEAIGKGDARIEVVAERLTITPRTLQRRLAQLDLTYRELVDDGRLRLAHTCLSHGHENREAVAARLGYSSASSLHRSLRRWRSKAE